jgi:hypothetical protein
MATFTFNLPDGKPVELVCPPGFTEEQARAVFDQQVNSGALVGAKPGFTLNAASQAKAGLKSAQALLSQAQAGVGNAFGSLTQSLGLSGGAQLGSLANTVPGLSGAVGVGAANDALSSITTAGAGASAAISTINKTVAGAPLTNPVNITDFAKQLPAVTSIAPLSQPEVTGALAQAKKLVGQPSNILSDAKGVGSFGLDASQLEKAGVIKPGSAKLVTSGLSSLKNLLKSPAAFTGKDGIKSANDLLANPAKQQLIQQDLMKGGLDALKAQGIPAGALSAQGATGAALNAAKNPTQAANFLKGIPVVGAGLAAAFTATTRDGAFAAVLSKDKIPAPFKAETVPKPAADTVNRDTVNAASARVVGNPKVPEPNYGPTKPAPGLADRQFAEIQASAAEVGGILQKVGDAFLKLDANVSYLESQQVITDTQWNAISAERDAARETFNSQLTKINAFNDLYNNSLSENRTLQRPVFNVIQKGIANLRELSVDTKNRIAELSKKRQGINDSSNRGE